MSDHLVIEQLLAYLPPDRAAAVLEGSSLPEWESGAVLFSDISGFTPLTEAVISRYGARRGGELFTDRLNAVYDALVEEVYRFGGSIVSFAGDAMVVWFRGDDATRAVTVALQMQRAMAQFAHIAFSDGTVASLGMKVAVCAGNVRRFQVGDPSIQSFDIMAGEIMERVSACEGALQRGEIGVDDDTARQLGTRLVVHETRPRSKTPRPGEVAIVATLTAEVVAGATPPLRLPADAAERLRPWLNAEVGRRVTSGQDVFLTELRPATALFARFSGIDFEHDPAAAEKLDAYIRWLQRIIVQLEGILVQLTIGEKGSYFYAAWGAPIAHDDDTKRACTAALEIVDPPSHLAGIIRTTQIGITRGTMRTGAYGNRRRRTYGVLGDDTNLAARLMTKAGPNEILISSHAARSQDGAFALQALPAITVKGKREPVPVFRLIGRTQEGVLEGTLAQREGAPMIGRQRERAFAVSRLQLALKKRGQVIAFSAEAGVGKSRLMGEVVRAATELGFAGFAGDCPVLAREASYSVWAPIWRAFFQLPHHADAATTLGIIDAWLATHAPAHRLRAPLLGAILKIILPDNELTAQLDAKVRRASTEGLVIECIRMRARSGPLLFVLDDCHWIDEASRSLLQSIVQAIDQLPVVIALAHRPLNPGEQLSRNDPSLDYVSTIELDVLPPGEARQLVETRLTAAFGTEAWDEWLIERIASRAEGNPFFIEEVVHLLKSHGTDLREARARETLDIPESLHSLVLGRIDHLTEYAQSTLKIASVIGRQFRVAMLFGVHPIEQVRSTLPAQLAELQERDMAMPEPIGREEAYVFRHIVIQEVAYESLPYAFRAAIHETIGGYLERAAGDNVRPWLDLLAFHYDRSNHDEKKRQYLVAAGDAARAGYALPSAISYYQRALALLTGGERVDVLARYAEVLELAGRWDDAFARYDEAREQALMLGLPAQSAALAGAIGDLQRKRGNFSAAATWIARARNENAELGNAAGVALMLHLEATLSAQTGNLVRASELYREALDARERLGDEAGAAKTLNNLGIVARSQGEIDRALGFYERSLAIRRRLNDRREIANSLNNLGFAHRYRKDFGRARELLEESVQMNRSIGDRWSTANALTSLAELALDTDDVELAQRCLKESITINRELGDRRALAFLLEGMGRLGRLKDDPVKALRYFAAAHNLRQAMGAPLEPADAEKLARAVEEMRAKVPPGRRAEIEGEGEALSLGDILDRAMAEP